MKVAFSVWKDRIAPLFDVSERVRIVDIEDGRIVTSGDEAIVADTPARRAFWIAARGVSVLVCGAVSRQLLALLSAYGIEVRPFASGSLEEVIEKWRTGGLDAPAYSMPGCPWMTGGGGKRRPGGKGRGEMRSQGKGQGGGAGSGGGARGRMGGSAMGPSGVCVCRACGYSEPHERGVPCYAKKCPRCGAPLGRE